MIDLKYIWIRNYETIRTIPIHSHSCFEFVYYLKGTGINTVNNEIFNFTSSTYALIPPNTLHQEAHKELTSVIAIGFSTTDFYTDLNTFFQKDSDSEIFNLIQTIRHEFKTKSTFYKQYIESIINQIIISLLRKTKTVDINDSFSYAISYIKEYYMTDINLSQIAKETGYCLDRFRILFAQRTGYTPKQYILNEKKKNAIDFLKDKSLPLNQVAQKCGFQIYSHFSLFFKKEFGVSPLEFRNNIKTQ